MSILFTKQWKSVYLAGLTVGVTQFDYQEMNGGIGYRSGLFHILSALKGHLEFLQRCLQLSYFRPADAIFVEKLVQLGRCSMTRFQHSNTVSWQREDFGLMLALTYKNVILYEDKYKCIMKVF